MEKKKKKENKALKIDSSINTEMLMDSGELAIKQLAR